MVKKWLLRRWCLTGVWLFGGLVENEMIRTSTGPYPAFDTYRPTGRQFVVIKEV